MTNLAEILEQELEEAVEVKNRKSLHRYAVILAENIVQRSVYEQSILEIKNDIKILTETMKQGFESIDKRFELIDKRFESIDKRFESIDKRFESIDKRFESIDKRFEDMYNYMNKRFEDVNNRFEDMNKRFSMMFTFMNIGFGIIILITVLFKFIQ
jgi:flagellar capping protein FliD